jgi:hypothetical protein
MNVLKREIIYGFITKLGKQYKTLRIAYLCILFGIRTLIHNPACGIKAWGYGFGGETERLSIHLNNVQKKVKRFTAGLVL